MSRVDELVTTFASAYAEQPDGVWFSPGRVNLLGEHTDYNGGFVLPIAISRGTWVAARRRDDDIVRLRSTHSQVSDVETTLGEISPRLGWAAYPAGVLWAANKQGYPTFGFDLYFDADMPLAAGLSSSASIACATAQAASDLLGWDATPEDVARLARISENDLVGSPTGIMDQLASACGRQDRALQIDTATEQITSIPLRLADFGLSLLVMNSHTPHDNLTSEYAERRRSCERAAASLNIPYLAQAPIERVDELDDDLLVRRARHVITDSQRVQVAADILTSNADPRELGPLFNASHVSMRDDFEITVPTIDIIQEAAVEAGAYGARMTGGGFGGCVIALIDQDAADDVLAACQRAAKQAGNPEPTAFAVEACDGARSVLRAN